MHVHRFEDGHDEEMRIKMQSQRSTPNAALIMSMLNEINTMADMTWTANMEMKVRSCTFLVFVVSKMLINTLFTSAHLRRGISEVPRTDRGGRTSHCFLVFKFLGQTGEDSIRAIKILLSPRACNFINRKVGRWKLDGRRRSVCIDQGNSSKFHCRLIR